MYYILVILIRKLPEKHFEYIIKGSVTMAILNEMLTTKLKSHGKRKPNEEVITWRAHNYLLKVSFIRKRTRH